MMSQSEKTLASTESASPPSAAASTKAAANAVPRALLENLSARIRPSGLCLMLLGADGNVLYHDAAAGSFFQRFALPVLQHPDRMEIGLRDHFNSQGANAPVTFWNALPGLAIAAFPFVERRQKLGMLVLVGKA